MKGDSYSFLDLVNSSITAKMSANIRFLQSALEVVRFGGLACLRVVHSSGDISTSMYCNA